MSSRLLCKTFPELFLQQEHYSIQTLFARHLSTLHRSRSNQDNFPPQLDGRMNRALMIGGVLLGGGVTLGAAVYRKELQKCFSSIDSSHMILKRSLCAQAINPGGVSESDLPGWTPRSRELYQEYSDRLLSTKGWQKLLTSVGRERNKTGFTLNHPEVGATFEYVMFFNEEERRSISIIQLGEKIQGPPGYVHGGAIATVGDACAGVLVYTGLKIRCVTANLTLNYKKPIPVNSTIIVETVLDKVERRKYFLTSVFKSPDGSIIYDVVITLFIDVDKK